MENPYPKSLARGWDVNVCTMRLPEDAVGEILSSVHAGYRNCGSGSHDDAAHALAGGRGARGNLAAAKFPLE